MTPRPAAVLLVGALALLAGCSSAPIGPARTPSTLNPQGPAAQHLASLWWLMFGLGAAIWLLVVALLFAALARRRRANSATRPESRGGDTGRRWLTWGGLALPLVILAIVFGYSTYTLAAIQQPARAPLEMKVIGRRWWWEAHYPAYGVTTANEIHIPVNTRTRITLESGDVIHSFWVPELHGKMDLVPTRINSITLQSNQVGVYRGECAEFCGLEHARMGFMVVVETPEQFNAWLAAQQQPASPPSDPAAQRGQQVFMTTCVFCHTIQGLDDKSVDRSGVDLGPDLTHFDGRLTLAGASVAKNAGNLAGWIMDPQHIKPGALMPNQYLNSNDLNDLLAYLATLK